MDDQYNQELSNKELLLNVKRRALKALTELLPEIDGIDAQQRFNIALNTLRSSDDLALLTPSLDAALAIEDKEIKAYSLIDLVGEIDYLEDKLSPQETDTPANNSAN